jgi:hypothetical protein
MSKLAELAGTLQLHGKVCVTGLDGVTHEYENEVVALGEWGDRVGELEHCRVR